jgi:hypothetical protein
VFASLLHLVYIGITEAREDESGLRNPKRQIKPEAVFVEFRSSMSGIKKTVGSARIYLSIVG